MYTYEKPKPQKATCPYSAALASPAVALGKDFCLETSMHGFRHVAEPGRHWAERVLWVAATSLAIWGAVDVSLGQLQRYNENPTVVTLEKDFRSWRFSLPAITACIKNRTDPSKLEQVIKNTWNVAPSDDKYEYLSRFVRVVSDSDLLHLDRYQEFKEDEDLDVDLYQLAVDVRAAVHGELEAVMPVVDIKTKISESFSLKWTPVMTEAGACYSINSRAIDDVAIVEPNPNDTMIYPITCKYGGSSCFIMLEVSSLYDFYFHSPYDVLDITEPATTVYSGFIATLDLSVTETGCGKEVKDLNPTRRACLFTDEPAEGRKVYSTNSCRLSCRSKVAMELCGCRPFYYFYEDGPACTPSGMACLSQHAQLLGNNGGHKCACSSQCLYSVFREIARTNQFWDHGPFSLQGSAKYTVQPPKIRYTREIVFHFQDLVVSFGGAAGLFLGASFISFVEILYFVLKRVLRAVSIEDAQAETIHNKPRQSTFEEQRIMELTTMLEYDLFNQEHNTRDTYF